MERAVGKEPSAEPCDAQFTEATQRFRRELLAYCYRVVGSAQDVAPADDPGTAAVARESLRLALIGSLQYLPAAQRAIFILREVLSVSAAEAAEILDTSTTGIKSGLQRARARLREVTRQPEQLLEPADQRARALLDGYIAGLRTRGCGAADSGAARGCDFGGHTFP